ncbi:hypothetical protein B0H19DRAFT_1268829 [Mycena capillaripes]|nr:hypothetical protein B0H19DRAFT_1268829 [Mycena capillaripes]
MSESECDEPSIDEILEDVGLTADILKTIEKHPEGTQILAEWANRMKISEKIFKHARRKLPSFSHVTWRDISGFFTLRPFAQCKFDVIPDVKSCFLPPHFHRKVFSQAWSAMDVYSEPNELALEAPKVRLLESFLVPILALFARVADLPEQSIPETALSSGGSVEHEIYIIGNILFFVIELKKDIKDSEENNFAQIFAELFRGAERNKNIAGFERLKVYGLLTDMGYQTGSSASYSKDMPTLKATCMKNEERSAAGSISPTGSSLVHQLGQTPSSVPETGPKTKGRPSFGIWEKARDEALAAQAKLSLFGTSKELQQTGEEGLKLLETNVKAVESRISKITTRYDLPSQSDLNLLAEEAFDAWHAWKTKDSALAAAAAAGTF